jgi:hypothetical protein
MTRVVDLARPVYKSIDWISYIQKVPLPNEADRREMVGAAILAIETEWRHAFEKAILDYWDLANDEEKKTFKKWQKAPVGPGAFGVDCDVLGVRIVANSQFCLIQQRSLACQRLSVSDMRRALLSFDKALQAYVLSRFPSGLSGKLLSDWKASIARADGVQDHLGLTVAEVLPGLKDPEAHFGFKTRYREFFNSVHQLTGREWNMSKYEVVVYNKAEHLHKDLPLKRQFYAKIRSGRETDPYTRIELRFRKDAARIFEQFLREEPGNFPLMDERYDGFTINQIEMHVLVDKMFKHFGQKHIIRNPDSRFVDRARWPIDKRFEAVFYGESHHLASDPVHIVTTKEGAAEANLMNLINQLAVYCANRGVTYEHAARALKQAISKRMTSEPRKEEERATRLARTPKAGAR